MSTSKGTVLVNAHGRTMYWDGQTQATYDGHPLYTYKRDTAAGQVNGNGLNLSGGKWWAITPSGAALGAKKSSSSGGSSGSGGGGGW